MTGKCLTIDDAMAVVSAIQKDEFNMGISESIRMRADMLRLRQTEIMTECGQLLTEALPGYEASPPDTRIDPNSMGSGFISCSFSVWPTRDDMDTPLLLSNVDPQEEKKNITTDDIGAVIESLKHDEFNMNLSSSIRERAGMLRLRQVELLAEASHLMSEVVPGIEVSTPDPSIDVNSIGTGFISCSVSVAPTTKDMAIPPILSAIDPEGDWMPREPRPSLPSTPAPKSSPSPSPF